MTPATGDTPLSRALLARALDCWAGGVGLFSPAGNYGEGAARSGLVLSAGKLPTTDLYLKQRLETCFGEAVRYVDVLETPPEQLTLDPKTLVVIVRHLPCPWLRWLEAQSAALAGVAFLMDDDLPAAIRAPELPFRYALKTGWRYARARRQLSRLCSEIWVSTPELVRRYPGSFPKLVEPHYVGLKTPGGAQPALVYFYHGTWAHRREIEWLVQIVRSIQASVPDAWFEIIGTARVKQMYQGIPRVRVIPPRSWNDYLDYSGTLSYAVGLAPCFDTPFNRARSHSKLFDITRIGAAGIYSAVTPYAEKIVPGQTGLLRVNEPDAWIAAISQLLHDSELRTKLHQQALAWCEKGGDR